MESHSSPSRSPPSRNSPSPPWYSRRNPPAARATSPPLRRGGRRLRAIPRVPRRGGPAGRAAVSRWSPRHEPPSDLEEDSPPRSPPRIRLPISPNRYGNLRPKVSPTTCTCPPPLATPRLATPDWLALVEWQHPMMVEPLASEEPDSPPSEPEPPVAPQPQKPVADEVDGQGGSSSCTLGEPNFWKDGMPMWLPCEPTTEEWERAVASAEREMKEDGMLTHLTPIDPDFSL